MIHLLALNIGDNYLLNLINVTSVEQILDIEEDNNPDSKGKLFEFDDEYLVNGFTNFNYHCNFSTQEFCSISSFQFVLSALPHRIHEILIPPPRA
jgi:hypothetical protein